jgi:hypothetical protein
VGRRAISKIISRIRPNPRRGGAQAKRLQVSRLEMILQVMKMNLQGLAATGLQHCRRFDPGGSLDRRVNCRRVPQPRWVGARRSTKGGRKRQRGNPRPLCCPAPRSGALAVGGYKRSRGRALRVGPSSRAANLLVREPWTFLL